VTGSRIGQAEEHWRVGRVDGNGERTACAAPGLTPIGTHTEPTEEYGYRDLGIIQDYRRQFLEPGFSRSPNDLALALRFYQLRRGFATNGAASAELDQIFLNIAAGQVKLAHQQLDQLAKQTSP
jgi:hypothetical protein